MVFSWARRMQQQKTGFDWQAKSLFAASALECAEMAHVLGQLDGEASFTHSYSMGDSMTSSDSTKVLRLTRMTNTASGPPGAVIEFKEGDHDVIAVPLSLGEARVLKVRCCATVQTTLRRFVSYNFRSFWRVQFHTCMRFLSC